MMRGGGWGRPRSYASMTDPGGGDRRGRGGGGLGRGGGGGGYAQGVSQSSGGAQQTEQQVGNVRETQILVGRRLAQEANREAIELKELALKKKAFLQLKWDLDCHRKHLGKGNIVNILINEHGQRVVNVDKANVNKMLRVSGFNTEDVMGITINEYRTNQVEVMFNDEVEVETADMEKKINSNGFDVSVTRFDKTEEFLSIYGLPLTNNVLYMEDQIREAIAPFVKEVTEIKPLVHSDELGDDFFKGKRNGNWRVKTIPKMNKQIPNYIVVGSREKVMGKVVYSKNAGEKLEMCSDCFSTEHFKRSPECSGPVKWSVYCDQFKEEWNKNFADEGDDEQVQMETGVSRVVELQKNLEGELAKIKSRETELASKHEGDQKKLEELNRKVTEMDLVNASLQVEVDKLDEEKKRNADLEEQVKNLTGKVKELETKSGEDQELMETAFSRIAANVTVRHRSLSLGSREFTGQPERFFQRNPPPGPSVLMLDGNSMERVTDESILGQTMVAEREAGSSGDMELNNESFQKGTLDFSPPCYGFDRENTGVAARTKLGQKIVNLQESSEVPEDKGEINVQEKGRKYDEIEEVTNLTLTSTPKRGRSVGEPKEQRKVKRRGGKKRQGQHPEIGSKIIMDTLSGEMKYVVNAKKNNKPDDFNYVLLNEEGMETSFDMKSQNWLYEVEEDQELNRESLRL